MKIIPKSFNQPSTFAAAMLAIMLLFTSFFSIIALLNQGTFLVGDSQKTSLVSISPTPVPTEIPQQYKIIKYYIPVTGFKELRNNINYSELKDIKIKLPESEFNYAKNYFPDLKFSFIPDAEFEEDIANGKDIALISWDKLTPKYKSLTIDNKDFFDKTTDLESYPLKYSENTTDKLKANGNFSRTKQNNIIATGEIIPARTTDRYMRTKNDYTYPFQSVKPFLDKFDAQVSTFETALLGSGNGNECALNCMTFIGNEKFMEGMKYSGVNLVSLADNHSMNGGIQGIANTIKLMNENNIKTIGASSTNNEDATKPQLLDVNGVKYGFIAYNDIPSVNDWATDTKGGTARIDDNNYKILPGRVAKDVQRAKDLGAQYIIAMMHWGAREYTNEPLPHQKELAHELVDNGVDLVIGDHPHWVMSTEFYTPKNSSEPKFIYYGIGNFIFDQDWSIETSQGSLLEMNFYENKLLSLRIHPHQIYQSQPRLLPESSKEYKQIFERIWQYTGKI